MPYRAQPSLMPTIPSLVIIVRRVVEADLRGIVTTDS